MRNTHIVKSQPIKNPPVGSAPIGGKHDHFIGGHDTGDTCTPSIRTCVSCQPTDVESMHSENLRSHRAMPVTALCLVLPLGTDLTRTRDCSIRKHHHDESPNTDCRNFGEKTRSLPEGVHRSSFRGPKHASLIDYSTLDAISWMLWSTPIPRCRKTLATTEFNTPRDDGAGLYRYRYSDAGRANDDGNADALLLSARTFTRGVHRPY